MKKERQTCQEQNHSVGTPRCRTTGTGADNQHCGVWTGIPTPAGKGCTAVNTSQNGGERKKEGAVIGIRRFVTICAMAWCLSSPVWAATLGNPSPGGTYSGIGVISGWKCDAGELTVRFNGGEPLPLSYGSVRTDVRDAGACPHAEVGFVAIWNWGNLGDGQHTAVVYDNGREFARSTFRVVTTGEAFLPDAEGQCVVPDFPAPGENAEFTWTTSTQHLELTDVGRHIQPPGQRVHAFDGRWDFRLTTQGTCRNRPPATFWIDITRSELTHIGETTLASFVVLENGHLEGTLTARDGLHVLSLTGLLTGRTGEGLWFNFVTCTGTWTATRR